MNRPDGGQAGQPVPAMPTYLRQRMVLFLLEAAGGRLGKMDLQKLLFLHGQERGTRDYAFVPYQFGCYSFQAAADVELLEASGWLETEGNTVRLRTAPGAAPWAARSWDRQDVRDWLTGHPRRGTGLVREIYMRYPYYAIRSRMKERVLDAETLRRVEDVARKLNRAGTVLFTAGYEGIAFEDFVNKLIRNGVRLLCDVRANPLSRKFGFSKRSLETLLPKLGIQYAHVPELGIASENRRDLETEADRTRLFAQYAESLTDREEGLRRVEELLREWKRVALACFEADPARCHRHCVSDALAERGGYRVKHL